MDKVNHLYTYTHFAPKVLKDKISLTPFEEKIFNLIMTVLQKHNNTTTICRVAGGWVRDKLLGKESIDIDIALSDMKGSQLASMLNDELYPGKDKVGVIALNAEKGKHLETATMKVYGQWIDFVNLRSEKEEIIGTPYEDAIRRDLTINSLFYNINNKNIEDFSGKGLDDLRNGIIRTPISPEIIFKDDYLRIIRAVRFAVRFQFDFANEFTECIKSHLIEIKYALSKLISVERIQKELNSIFEGNNPQCGVYIIYSFGLWDALLQLESFGVKEINDNEIVCLVNLAIIGNYIINSSNDIKEIIANEENTQGYKKGLFYFLITIPFRNYQVKSGKNTISISHSILFNVLKLSNDEIRDNKIQIENVEEFINEVNKEKYNRLSSGKVLRRIKYKNIYKIIIGAIALEYLTYVHNNKSEIIQEVNESKLNDIIKKYKMFYLFIEKENLLHIDEMKPILDGNDIIKELKVPPGKEIQILLDSLILQQIEYPDTNWDEAVEFLKKKREEIKGSVIQEEMSEQKSGKKKKNKNKK